MAGTAENEISEAGLDTGFRWLSGRLVHLKGANTLLPSSLPHVLPRCSLNFSRFLLTGCRAPVLVCFTTLRS